MPKNKSGANKSGAPAINIGIGSKDRAEIAGGLSKLLADTYTLYLTTHNFHWNVTGPMFNTLHDMFMEQYTELWNAVDPIAERIRHGAGIGTGGRRLILNLRHGRRNGRFRLLGRPAQLGGRGPIGQPRELRALLARRIAHRRDGRVGASRFDGPGGRTPEKGHRRDDQRDRGQHAPRPCSTPP